MTQTPTWRERDGQCIADFDTIWLYTYAYRWYWYADEEKITLRYYSSEPMPASPTTKEE